MTEPFAKVTNVWAGGPNSFSDPQDMPEITFSKREIVEFGGADKEKINFGIEYDVTAFDTAANISITLLFDKTITVGQTDLKSVQGLGTAAYRMNALPKYDNQKRIGYHTLDIVIKLRKRFSIWDALAFPTVSETRVTRKIILVE